MFEIGVKHKRKKGRKNETRKERKKERKKGRKDQSTKYEIRRRKKMVGYISYGKE